MPIKEDMIKCESVFTLVSFSDDFLKNSKLLCLSLDQEDISGLCGDLQASYIR